MNSMGELTICNYRPQLLKYIYFFKAVVVFKVVEAVVLAYRYLIVITVIMQLASRGRQSFLWIHVYTLNPDIQQTRQKKKQAKQHELHNDSYLHNKINTMVHFQR